MIDSPLRVVKSVVPKLLGIKILDVRNGDGKFARLLADESARIVGIDTNPDAVKGTKCLVNEARLVAGSVEPIPFESSQFDLVVYVNARHHVPVQLMATA